MQNLHLTFVLKCLKSVCTEKKNTKRSIVVIHYCAWHSFFRNGRYVVPVKSKLEISQHFLVFSEYMNFTYTLVLVLYLIPSWSVQKSSIQGMLLCPNSPINQFQLVQRSRKKSLRAYCTNIYCARVYEFNG